MREIILKNICLNDDVTDILVSDAYIKKVAKNIVLDNKNVDVVDCTGKTVIPSFINMHTHAAMTIMRGLEEDVSFHSWLKNIWDIESKIDHEHVYWGTKVACLEMIKTGTTIFNDQYWFMNSAYKACSEMGIHPTLSYVILDKNNREEALRQKDQCAQKYEESQSWTQADFALAFHAIYSVSEEMIVWANEFARNHNLRLHIHLSETQQEILDCKREHNGLTPVEYLNELGVLGPHLIAAHTLWLSENDIRLLGENHVNCVHNINSNTKLTSGYKFLYNELKDAGANICIGTDGCASSNNLDMLEAMKTSALIQKAWRYDPKVMPINELMDMATKNGAKALGIKAGEIKEGYLANLSIVNTDNTFFLSNGSFLANLIYSAHSDCIESVMSYGKWVMRDRIVKEEKDIIYNTKKIINNLR